MQHAPDSIYYNLCSVLQTVFTRTYAVCPKQYLLNFRIVPQAVVTETYMVCPSQY